MLISMIVAASLMMDPDQRPTAPPPAVPRAIPIEKAEAEGLISLSIGAVGGSSGDVIVLRVRRLTPRRLRVNVPSGLVLRNQSAAAQNMVVSTLKGELDPGGLMYEPSTVIELIDNGEHAYVVEAFCLDFEKDNPGEADEFSIGPVDEDALALMRAIPKSRHSTKVIQAALWIRAGISDSKIKERFDVNDLDLLDARMAVQQLQRRRP